MSSVIIIGAGAAGLMAAYSAGLSGHSVRIFESNEKAGKKIYITHGHRHYVKSGMSDLYDLAERKGYAAVFFGHTHSPVCSYFKGTWFLNPGSAGMPYDGKPKAAVLDITDTGVFGFLTELN